MVVKSRHIKGARKRFKKQSYSRLMKEASEAGVAFSDMEFKPDDASIYLTTGYKSRLGVGRVVWKRPRELCSDPHFLYKNKLGPATDIHFLGYGPNQWLIAAAFAISQDKSNVYKIIPKEQYHFLRGAFKIYLWQAGSWFKLIIDDKLPTYDTRLIFTSSQCGTLFWVPLLEKALAKLYGNYERLSVKCGLKDALTHLTGAPTESIPVGPADDEKAFFRLIAEELDRKSLICAETGLDLPPNVVLKSSRIYVIDSVRKPTSGSFKKNVKEATAMIHVIDTIYEEKKSRYAKPSFIDERFEERWISIDLITKHLVSLTICRLNIGQHKNSSSRSALAKMQYCFDVTQDSDEVMIDLYQNSDEPRSLGFKIYRVETNRQYKVHNFSTYPVVVRCEPSQQLNIFRRVTLTYGRYVLVSDCTDDELKLFLRLYTDKVSNLRVLSLDMPRRKFLSFLSPKYPKFVSRIVVKGAHSLDKQDRFGSANPYCVIRCGRVALKSLPANDTLNPDWSDFSAIFYHGKFVSIIVEVWHRSFFIDSFVGQVEIIPNIGNDGAIQEAELFGKKKAEKSVGTVKYQLFTYEDLRSF